MRLYSCLILVKMKVHVLLLALLQCLGCSGIPLYNLELESMADRGFGASLAEVNSLYAVNHLYRVTQGSISRVIPVGLNTTDLLMIFRIKETECAKASRSDPQTCSFRPGFFVPSFSCSSRVRMSTTSAQVVSLRCSHGSSSSSSSSESSEEIFSRGRHQVNNPSRDSAPFATPPPPTVLPVRPLHSQPVNVRPRGDVFSNLLE
nr:secreted phosphoprotein 24 [Monopterus albus]